MENEKEVETTTTPENESNQEELDSILDALSGEDDGSDGEKPAPKDDKSSNSDEDKNNNGDDKPFKTVGNHVFKTEQEYDKWALTNYGEVSRLSGELKKAKSSAPSSENTKVDIDALRVKMRVADFFENNPDAAEYKAVIAGFLRSGKAKSLDEAYGKALKADGKEVEKKEEINKQVFKAGGSEQGAKTGNEPYTSDDDIKSISDFADSALLGKF